MVRETVHVRLINGADVAERDLYIPKPVLAQRAGAGAGNNVTTLIHRTGTSFTWTPDPNNATGRIAVHYQVSDAAPNAVPSQQHVLAEDVIVVPDNGTFTLDNLLPVKAASVRLTFITGNSLSLTTGGRKILFDISSYDHHAYTIVD